MLIAIYNGFTFIHYEMIGHVIEYCILNNLNYHIYACDDKYNEDEITIYLTDSTKSRNDYDIVYSKHLYGIYWREYYKQIFNTDMKWFNPNLFNPEEYDIIFLLTDTDIIKPSILSKYYYKIICIFHTKENINRIFLGNILVRYLFMYNNIDWVLPCYKAIIKEDKQKILIQNQKIIITCIGIIYGDTDMESIFKKYFIKDYNNIEFHIISRKISYNYESSNIFTHENCNTNIMYEILKNTNYIFCINSVKEYCDTKLSACIPLGISFGCQIIMPMDWYRFYNLNSVISYNENSIFSLKKVCNLDIVYNELDELIEHKNNIYNKLIEERKLYLIHPELYILKISNIYNIKLPNIYFGFI